MGRTRAFLPPSICSRCNERPALGETLFHTGEVWICAACLTNDVPGDDVLTKMASRSISSEQSVARSRRAKTAGDIEESVTCDAEARWHSQAVRALRSNGMRAVQGIELVNGEAVPSRSSYLRDTLADPDLVAIESSYTRGGLLHSNNVVALGIDVANAAGASNTHEKLIAHQIAVAHKVAMEQASRAMDARGTLNEIKHVNASARMMAMAQQGMLTLQKLKTGGAQSIVVQHVHVESGGQAVVGAVQTREREK